MSVAASCSTMEPPATTVATKSCDQSPRDLTEEKGKETGEALYKMNKAESLRQEKEIENLAQHFVALHTKNDLPAGMKTNEPLAYAVFHSFEFDREQEIRSVSGTHIEWDAACGTQYEITAGYRKGRRAYYFCKIGSEFSLISAYDRKPDCTWWKLRK